MLSIVSKAHSYKSDDVQFTYLRPISVKSSFLGPTFRTNFLGVKGFCFKARIFCTGLSVGSIGCRTPVLTRRPTFRTLFWGVGGFCFKARISCTGLLVGSIESRTPVSMRVGWPFVDNGGLSGFKLALEIG